MAMEQIKALACDKQGCSNRWVSKDVPDGWLSIIFHRGDGDVRIDLCSSCVGSTPPQECLNMLNEAYKSAHPAEVAIPSAPEIPVASVDAGDGISVPVTAEDIPALTGGENAGDAGEHPQPADSG